MLLRNNGNPTPGVVIGADPVVLATGNYIHNHIDFQIPSRGFPFEFKRFYNSKFSDQTGVPLGYGWIFNYNERVRDTTTNVLVIQGDGSTLTFFPTNGGYVGEEGVFDSLIHNTSSDNTWTLTDKSQTVKWFSMSGQLSSITDKNGNTLGLFYTNGILRRIEDTAGRSIFLNTNSLGCISDLTDPLGRTIRFEYDANTNLIAVIDANNQTNRYSYDPSHQMTDGFDAKGTLYIHNEYNPTNFTVLKQHDVLTNWTYFSYDFTNRTTFQTNALGKLSIYKFDDRLLVTNILDEAVNREIFSYDTNRNQTSIQDKNGNQTHYAYDALGNMTNKLDVASKPTSIQYNALNNPISRVDALSSLRTSGYDANGNLTATTNALGFTSRVQYNANGLPFILTDGRGFNTTNQYDSAGNLVAIISRLTNVVNYVHDSDNRLTAIDGETVTHDANGALTGIGPNTYSYDVEDRLTQFALTNASGTCTYDGLGNRLARTVNGQSRRFVLDRTGALTQVLMETDTNGSPIAYYVYGAGLAQRITPDGQTTTYHYNIQGSTVALTDSTGTITDSYAYDSFGVLVNSDGNSSQPFRYLGLYGIVDDGTGLYQARARYFNPQLGRFLTKDPVTGKDSDSQSLNRYIYALNNPLRFLDSSGLSAHEGHIVSQYNPYAGEAAYWQTYYEETKWMRPWLTAFKWAGEGAQVALGFLSGGGTTVARTAIVGATTKGGAVIATTAVESAIAKKSVTSVYSAVENGVVKYIGITDNVAARAATHLTEKGIIINEIPGLTGLVRSDARAVEQVLIEKYGLGKNGGTLLNQINSISAKNPIYQNAVQRGNELLNQIGY